ncbi:Phosphoserine phosphatase [Nymphaea thermarum]|nr:Phosphoserine phosphatase [Nymphaea thermarum]
MAGLQIQLSRLHSSHPSPSLSFRPLLRSSRLLLSPASFSGSRFSFSCLRDRLSVVVMAAPVQPDQRPPTLHDNSLPTKEVLEIWRGAEAVCFDVDSTVCLDEGIDELAEFCGAGQVVAEWTRRAMGGSVPFEEALAARLNLFKPSLAQVNDFLIKKPPRLSPGIADLMKKLKAENINVYLISGGFRQMINPVASILGIPHENIYANELLFGCSGEFVGFNTEEPTSRSGGKAVAVESIKKKHGYKLLVMIGDGATDLEARRPGGADLFICYGGVQLRESVAAKADWLVFNFQDLIESFGVCN